MKSGGQRYKVQKVIQHEQYNKPPFANDIGLVRINGKIEFNEKVQPIKYSNKFVKGATKLSTTGWGRIRVKFYALLLLITRGRISLEMWFDEFEILFLCSRLAVRYPKS